MITSPACKPARAAGPFSVMPETIMPYASIRLRAARQIFGVGLCRIPIQPRLTSPLCSSCLTIHAARLAGIAKPIYMLLPEVESSAELMPITSPLVLNIGPPELPWLMAASVWIKLSYGPAAMSPRDLAETMPAVTLPPSPTGCRLPQPSHALGWRPESSRRLCKVPNCGSGIVSAIARFFRRRR